MPLLSIFLRSVLLLPFIMALMFLGSAVDLLRWLAPALVVISLWSGDWPAAGYWALSAACWLFFPHLARFSIFRSEHRFHHL